MLVETGAKSESSTTTPESSQTRRLGETALLFSELSCSDESATEQTRWTALDSAEPTHFAADGEAVINQANRAWGQPATNPSDQPRRPALPPLGFIIIARRLLHGAMLRLLHRLRQRNPAPRRLGEIAGPQSMRGKLLGVEPG